VPVARRSEVEQISGRLALPLSCIGKIVAGHACNVLAADGSVLSFVETGYDHFK
jgi:thiamine monophosphate kinase